MVILMRLMNLKMSWVALLLRYLFSIASSKRIFSIDSLTYFNLGVNFKSAYSQLYYENSFAVLFDRHYYIIMKRRSNFLF